MLNYANLYICKALLFQQDLHQKFLQAELARQKSNASMNSNFHSILDTLQSLDNRLTAHMNSTISADISALHQTYASFCTSAEAWWTNHT